MRVERPGRGHPPVLGLDATAGEDEFARHEPMAGMSLAHQYARFSALRAFYQNERRRITRAQRAFPRSGVGHVLVPMCDPNPCMPRAHCWPTIAPFARGKMMRLASAVAASQNAMTQSIDECGQISSDSRIPAPTACATIKSVT